MKNLILITLIFITMPLSYSQQQLKKLLEMDSPADVEREVLKSALKVNPVQGGEITLEIGQFFYKENLFLPYTAEEQTYTEFMNDWDNLNDITKFGYVPIFGNYDLQGKYNSFINRTGYKINTLDLIPYQLYISNIGLFDANIDLYDVIDITYVQNSEKQNIYIKYLKPGDLIIDYSFATNGGSLVHKVVYIHCPQIAYGSFMSLLDNKSFYIDGLKFSLSTFEGNTSTNEQYNFDFRKIRTSDFGRTFENSFSVSAFLKPENFQGDVVNIPFKDVLTNYVMYYYKIAANIQKIEMTFKLNYIDKSNPVRYEPDIDSMITRKTSNALKKEQDFFDS